MIKRFWLKEWLFCFVFWLFAKTFNFKAGLQILQLSMGICQRFQFKTVKKFVLWNYCDSFYRLKKIQDKKRIIRAKAEALKASRAAQGEDYESTNMLDEGDEDILF